MKRKHIGKIKKLIEKDKPKRPYAHKNYGACFWCPNCKGPITIEYQDHCQNCGQRLDWKKIAQTIKILEYLEMKRQQKNRD